MIRLWILISITVLACAKTSLCQAQTGAEWPFYRHDMRLTGRSSAVGNMRDAPTERWKYYLGGWKNEFRVTFAADQSSKLKLRGASEVQELVKGNDVVWNSPKLVDLAGDGNLVSPPPGKVARLLPNVRGLQQVVWEHPPGKPTLGVGRCYSFERGADKPRLVWQTEEEPQVYELLWAVADMDGDELPEVVFMTHYRVLVYNGQTGEKKSTLQWPIGRNYGQMTLADVDGDKLPEVVVVVDSPPHVDVLKYAPKQGTLLWSQRSRLRAVRRRTWPQIEMESQAPNDAFRISCRRCRQRRPA